MATRDPGFGRAFEQAGQNVLEAFIQRAQLDFRREALAQEQAQFEASLSEEQKVNALNRLATIVPFIKPGTTVAENPLLHEDWRTLFPGSDPTDVSETGAGSMVMTPETLETALRPALVQRVKELSAPGQERIMSRVANKILLGEPLTDEELVLQDTVVEVQRQSLDSLVRDPKLLAAVGRKTLGLEVPVRFRVGGKELSFDTEAAARLWVEVWKHNDLMDLYNRQLTADKQKMLDMAGEFMKQVSEATGGKVQISRARANEILMAAHAGDQGQALNQLRLHPEYAPGTNLGAALDMYQFAASIGTNAVPQFLQQHPDLAEYLNVGAYLSRSADQGGAGLSKETVNQILPGIARQMQKGGYPIAAPGRYQGVVPFGLTGGVPRLHTVEPPPAVSAPPAGAPSAIPGVTQYSDEQARLRNEMIADRDAYAAGRLSSTQLRQKWDPETATAIMRDGQALKKQGAK